ncbi:hypothetical protein [Kribbella karoonensis]|uniref:hypothetical protein n=1 Tax=Kribbella karoonensis TaxID=324851 RepID=UPI0031DD1158
MSSATSAGPAVVARPLQPRLDDASWSGVRYSDAGIDYVVTVQAVGGSRSADVNVTTRRLADDQEPCTGFTDRTDGSVTGCAVLDSDVWKAQGAHGEVHYFVRAEAGQWAYVRSERYDYFQQWHDAQAARIARSLEARSTWPLAADAADCEYCQWFT